MEGRAACRCSPEKTCSPRLRGHGGQTGRQTDDAPAGPSGTRNEVVGRGLWRYCLRLKGTRIRHEQNFRTWCRARGRSDKCWQRPSLGKGYDLSLGPRDVCLGVCSAALTLTLAGNVTWWGGGGGPRVVIRRGVNKQASRLWQPCPVRRRDCTRPFIWHADTITMGADDLQGRPSRTLSTQATQPGRPGSRGHAGARGPPSGTAFSSGSCIPVSHWWPRFSDQLVYSLPQPPVAEARPGP